MQQGCQATSTLTLADDIDLSIKERVTGNTLVKYTYESFIPYHFKVMANVKVFLRTNWQTDKVTDKRGNGQTDRAKFICSQNRWRMRHMKAQTRKDKWRLHLYTGYQHFFLFPMQFSIAYMYFFRVIRTRYYMHVVKRYTCNCFQLSRLFVTFNNRPLLQYVGSIFRHKSI